jgi:hypothetical protein
MAKGEKERSRKRKRETRETDEEKGKGKILGKDSGVAQSHSENARGRKKTNEKSVSGGKRREVDKQKFAQGKETKKSPQPTAAGS